MRIVTDTGVMYSPEEGKKLGFDVLPLNVTVNGKTYREYVDIFSEEYIEIVREGHIPMSSQPSVGTTLELFEGLNGEETLVINMADGTSITGCIIIRSAAIICDFSDILSVSFIY